MQRDEYGDYVEVDTDQGIFEGVDEKDYAKIAKMYIQDYLSGNSYNTKDGEKIGITSRTAKKYPYAKDVKTAYAAKMRMTPEIENAISVAEPIELNVPDENNKHDWADLWDYYKVRFKLDGKFFDGELQIANTSTGDGKILYDIQIKETSANDSSAKSTGYASKGLFSGDIIPQSQRKVNDDVRYSISNDVC